MPQDKPPLVAGRDRPDPQLDRRGGRRRHARERRAAATTRTIRRSTPGPPVITALDFSPDGKLLAVAGFHEVLLCEGRRLGARRPAGRPVRADRVGPVLARRQAAGRHRRPARPDGRGPGLGRRQEEARCSRSPSPSTRVYGASWSPDGTQDRLRLRRQHGPGDRRRDRRAGPVHGLAQRLGRSTRSSPPTARTWSRVGRDMAAKLTEVATQRFVDNITSITPGRAQGRHRRPSPATRSATRSSSAAPTACPRSTASSARPPA